MAKYFVWNISNTFDVFNSIACNKEFDFGTENQQTILQKLHKDDCILGVQNNSEIFTILKVCNVNGTKLRLMKDFETSNVISIVDYGISFLDDELVELDEDKYYLLENQLKGNTNNTKNVPSSKKEEKAPELPYPKNRIIFGAPGTGKSHAFEEQSVVFTNQKKNVLDPLIQIKLEIDNACKQKGNGKLALLNSVGFKYSSFLSKKSMSEIKNQIYNQNGYDGIYNGANAKIIADTIVIDDEKDIEEQIRSELDKAKKPGCKYNLHHYINAIGYKFSDYLIDQKDLEEKYDLHNAQWWWFTRGIQVGQMKLDKIDDSKLKFKERVTFHPNYSYSHFVGTYKPIKSKVTQEEITYEYVPGPFMRVYVNAKKNPGKNFLLLIEEINRANVAAVFGDVFQLLDRKNGESQYPITPSEDQKNYLESEGIVLDEISIPSNMYIWATMNSADQGVLPMDAAFKRRWDFEYLGIDDNQEKILDYNVPYKKDGSKIINWNDFRVKLNEKLAIELKINEDKQLGPFFMNETSLENALKEPDTFVKLFESKVLMYLYEDVVKMNPKKLFSDCGEDLRYSKICQQWEEKGPSIFGIVCDDIAKEQKTE